jgi:hypothetical protein
VKLLPVKILHKKKATQPKRYVEISTLGRMENENRFSKKVRQKGESKPLLNKTGCKTSAGILTSEHPKNRGTTIESL